MSRTQPLACGAIAGTELLAGTSNGRAPRRRSGRLPRVAVCMVAAGAMLVVLDGSWSWAATRVAVLAGLTAWLCSLVRNGSRRRAGAMVALIGCVAVAGGGAIVVSYAASGWSLRLLGGTVAAFGGVVAIAVGLTAIVGTLSGWRRLLLVPIVAVTVYAIGMPVAVAVYATNVGRPQLGSRTPADAGVAFVDARFTTTDGVTLSGWYIPSRNGAAVVMLHGASSTRSAVLDQALVTARHGFGVFLYDARGMGRSGGRAMDFGWAGDRDIAAAVAYLQTQADVDPARIAAVGESMGGEEAIGAMATNGALRAVVAEGATNRVAADWDWLSDTYGVRGRVQQGVQWLTYELADLLTDLGPPIPLREAVASSRRPVLLITAGNVADEANAARSIQQGAPDKVAVWNVPGADHTGGLRARPDEWERRVTRFLAAALGTSP